MSEESKNGERIKLGGGPVYDTDLLGGSASKSSGGYVASIATGGDQGSKSPRRIRLKG